MREERGERREKRGERREERGERRDGLVVTNDFAKSIHFSLPTHVHMRKLRSLSALPPLPPLPPMPPTHFHMLKLRSLCISNADGRHWPSTFEIFSM